MFTKLYALEADFYEQREDIQSTLSKHGDHSKNHHSSLSSNVILLLIFRKIDKSTKTS